ncbi:hypothetical protein V6Z11_A08G296600 [Gossypium hirsutum]
MQMQEVKMPKIVVRVLLGLVGGGKIWFSIATDSKLWLCKISPAMASLLQSISITLILIPKRHAIPFIVLHGFPVFLFKESLLRSVEIMDLGVGFCFGVWARALLSLWSFGLLSRLEAV